MIQTRKTNGTLSVCERGKRGEAFLWNSHFVQIKKVGSAGPRDREFHGREGLDYLGRLGGKGA